MHTVAHCGALWHTVAYIGNGVEEEGAPLAGEGAPRGRPGRAALHRDQRPLPMDAASDGRCEPST